MVSWRFVHVCFVQVTILKLVGAPDALMRLGEHMHFPTDICSVIQEGEITVGKCAHQGASARQERHTLSLGRNKHGHNDSAPIRYKFVAEETPGGEADPAAMEKICRLLGVRPEDLKLILYRSPTPRYMKGTAQWDLVVLDSSNGSAQPETLKEENFVFSIFFTIFRSISKCSSFSMQGLTKSKNCWDKI